MFHPVKYIKMIYMNSGLGLKMWKTLTCLLLSKHTVCIQNFCTQ